MPNASGSNVRFGAIDVGSNAIRIKLVEARSASEWTEIHSSRHSVRIGREVFLSGQIPPQALEDTASAFRSFRELLGKHGIERVRAVATCALREAKNRKAVVDRLRRDSELVLEVVEGLEEARLIYLAIERATDVGVGRVALIDIGGGSVELTGLADGAQRFAASLPLGTVRLLEAFLGDRPVTRVQETLLREYVDRILQPALSSIGPLGPTRFIGTGGNFERLALLCPTLPGQRDQIDVPLLRELWPKIARLSVQERQAAFGLREDRADVIVPAAFVLLRIADALGAERIVVPGVSLRDGVLREMIEKHYGAWDYRREADAILGGARSLGRRLRFDEAHALQTMKLATQLFDDLESLHGLGRDERLLLRVAALLHDIGDFIADGGHHKHSYYVIQHSDIGGLLPRPRKLCANVARYHRGADPTPEHSNLEGLDKAELATVRKLAAILRIADALDRAHLQKVTDLSVSVDRKRVVLRVRGDHDLSLETWTAKRKSPLFEQVFDRSLEVEGPQPP